MAEKLIVEKVYEDDDVPVGDCQIYTISSPSDDTPICSVESEGLAHAFAASRLMLEALERVLAVYGLPERAIAAAIPDVIAAIKAAKGE
jgi:hypothetical protein